MTQEESSSGTPLSTIGRLRATLRTRLLELGYEVTEEHPDHLVVEMNNHPHSIYLSNLSRALELGQQAHSGQPPQVAQEDLRQAVDEWLTVHLRQVPTRESIEDRFGTLDAVRSLLLPRLTPSATMNQPGQRWARPLCPEFIDLALVIDQPDIVTFATPQMVAGWGPAEAEAVAMANLRGMATLADFRPLGR